MRVYILSVMVIISFIYNWCQFRLLSRGCQIFLLGSHGCCEMLWNNCAKKWLATNSKFIDERREGRSRRDGNLSERASGVGWSETTRDDPARGQCGGVGVWRASDVEFRIAFSPIVPRFTVPSLSRSSRVPSRATSRVVHVFCWVSQWLLIFFDIDSVSSTMDHVLISLP
jgi:hypothetical protein